MKSLPKLVIFRDLEKRGVSEAIDEFLSFAKDKAEIVASYGNEDLKQTCTNTLLPEDANVLEKCDFAIVFEPAKIPTRGARMNGVGRAPVALYWPSLGFKQGVLEKRIP